MATTSNRNVKITITADDKASGKLKTVSKELSGLNKPGANAGAAMNQAAAGASNLNKQAGPAANAVNKVGENAKGAGVGVGTFSKALGPLGGILTGVTGALGGVTAAVAAAAAAVGVGIGKWLDYQEVFGQIGNMAKIFGQDSKRVVADIQSVAKSIGNMSGKSTLEIAEIGSTVYAMTGNVDKATAAMKTFAGMAATLPKMRARAAIMALTEAYDGNSESLEKLSGFTRKQMDELDSYSEASDRAARASQMASEKFDKMAGAADKNVVAVANMKKEVGGAARELGSTFAPAIVKASGDIGNFATGFVELIKKIKDFTKLISEPFVISIEYVVGKLNLPGSDDSNKKHSIWNIKNAPYLVPAIAPAYGAYNAIKGIVGMGKDKKAKDIAAEQSGSGGLGTQMYNAAISASRYNNLPDTGGYTFAGRADTLSDIKINWRYEKGVDLPLSKEKTFWESALASGRLNSADTLRAKEALAAVEDAIKALGESADKTKKKLIDFEKLTEWPQGIGTPTSGFGWRTKHGKSQYHSRYDIGMPEGTPLTTVLPGKIISAKDEGGFGITVRYEVAPGLVIRDSHMRNLDKNIAGLVGQYVPAGTPLGASGHTGDVMGKTGNHVDRGFYVNGVASTYAQANAYYMEKGGPIPDELDSWKTSAEAAEKAAKDAQVALEKAQKDAYDAAIRKAESDLSKFIQSNIGVKIPYSSESVAYWNSMSKTTEYLDRGQQQHRIMKQLKTQREYDEQAALLDLNRIALEPGVDPEVVRRATIEYDMRMSEIGQRFLQDTEEMFTNFDEVDQAYKEKWFEDNFGLWDEFLNGLDANATKTRETIQAKNAENAAKLQQSMEIRSNFLAAEGPMRGRDIQGNLTGSDFDYNVRLDAMNRARDAELKSNPASMKSSIEAKYDAERRRLNDDYYKWIRDQEWYFTQFSAKELNVRLQNVKTSESDKQAIRTEFARRAREGEIGGTTAFKLGLQENFNAFKTYQEMMQELGGQTANNMQTAFGDLFVDAFRNDLDGAKDIFDEFTRTIIDSWVRMLGQLAAQQIGAKLGLGNLLGSQGGGANPFSNPAFYAQGDGVGAPGVLSALPAAATMMAAAGGSTAAGMQAAQAGGMGGGLASMGMVGGMSGGAAGAVAGGAGNVAAVSGGKGIMGGIGKAMGWLGIGLMVASLFKKGPGAPNSGPAAALPQFQGINQIGGGLDVLRGSSFYTRAAFSPRNADGSVIAGMANLRTGSGAPVIQQTIVVKPGGMFETEVQNTMVEGVRLGNSAGVPRRTGFTHG